MKPRIFILGSCVSRDVWSMPDVPFELAGYIARSSLASIFNVRCSPRRIFQSTVTIGNRFQRRMVQLDLSKGGEAMLVGKDFDYLLLDLVDERFDLVRFQGWAGGVYTLSAEFRRILPKRNTVLVARGSAEYMDEWRKGLQRLVQLVDPSRIILNDVRWATHSTDGHALPEEWNSVAESAHIEALYREVMKVDGIRKIGYQDNFVADPSHRWGLAPFHYKASIYASAIRGVDEIIRADQGQAGE